MVRDGGEERSDMRERVCVNVSNRVYVWCCMCMVFGEWGVANDFL